MGKGNFGRVTPIDSYLRYELSGVDITNGNSNKPVCKRCDDLGEAGERLTLDHGEPVYACAYWGFSSGWELLGVYHDDHDVSGIVDSDPPRPVAILRGTVEKTDLEADTVDGSETYTLVDLSVDEFSYPTLGD